jgi:hypothetical protein
MCEEVCDRYTYKIVDSVILKKLYDMKMWSTYFISSSVIVDIALSPEGG